MEPTDLLDTWTDVARRLRGAAHVCILCDDDGTLLPPAPPTQEPRLPQETWRNLQRLSTLRKVTLGVLSGRPLGDVRRLLQIDHAWTSGLYGHEIRNPQGLERRWFTRKEERRIAAMADRLDRELSPVPGVRVLRKGGGLLVHYREVEPERVREVQEAVLQVWKKEGHGLRFQSGDQEVEILAAENRGKGTAVRFILGKIPARTLPLYFGDDPSDLPAFRALRAGGIRVGVGGVVSPHLDYRLKDPEAVCRALGRMADLLERGA